MWNEIGCTTGTFYSNRCAPFNLETVKLENYLYKTLHQMYLLLLYTDRFQIEYRRSFLLWFEVIPSWAYHLPFSWGHFTHYKLIFSYEKLYLRRKNRCKQTPRTGWTAHTSRHPAVPSAMDQLLASGSIPTWQRKSLKSDIDMRYKVPARYPIYHQVYTSSCCCDAKPMTVTCTALPVQSCQVHAR